MAPKTRSQTRLNPEPNNENLFNQYQNPLYFEGLFEQSRANDKDNTSMVNFSDNNDDTNDLLKTEQGRTLLNQYLSQNKDDLFVQLIEIGAKLPLDYDLTNLSNIIPKKDQSFTNPEHATSSKHN